MNIEYDPTQNVGCTELTRAHTKNLCRSINIHIMYAFCSFVKCRYFNNLDHFFFVDIVGVTGSIPVSPTILTLDLYK